MIVPVTSHNQNELHVYTGRSLCEKLRMSLGITTKS